MTIPALLLDAVLFCLLLLSLILIFGLFCIQPTRCAYFKDCIDSCKFSTIGETQHINNDRELPPNESCNERKE